jgi:hypothetical protein
MNNIKAILVKELKNSIRQESTYRKALEELPGGALIKKEISGHHYYYLMSRSNKKVKFIYRGKISGEEIKRYDNLKQMRMNYRKSLAQVRKRISFLMKILNTKEMRAVS